MRNVTEILERPTVAMKHKPRKPEGRRRCMVCKDTRVVFVNPTGEVGAGEFEPCPCLTERIESEE